MNFDIFLNLEYLLNIFFISINSIILLLIAFSFNPIFSISYLILFFFVNCVFLIFLKIEFLALLFLFLYAGAISVLFLFVVLLFDIKFLLLYSNMYINLNFFYYFLLVFQIVFFFIFHDYWTYFSLNNTQVNVYVNWLDILYKHDELGYLGLVLFSYYYYYVILLSFILFITTLGVILIGMNKNIIVLEKNFYFLKRDDFKSLFYFK